MAKGTAMRSPQPRGPAPDEAARPPVELARAAAQGDLHAARQLIELVAPTMIRAVRSVMGPIHPDVEDVAQQALIAFVQSLPKFRGECQPAFYAARIAVREALANRRSARKQLARQEALAELQLVEGLTAPSPTEQALATARRNLIRSLLDELPTEQGETLALHVVLGLSLRDVAAATRVPVNTVKSRLRLAKRALRKRIQADPALAEQLEVQP